jgi:hypothetical protein
MQQLLALALRLLLAIRWLAEQALALLHLAGQ